MNTTDDTILWKTKLAARLHDPVEKALILMRTVEGHEGGTSKELSEKLGLTKLSAEIDEAVKRADRWASAADRAAFPNRNRDGRYPAWQSVQFHKQAVIIHPLTGEEFGIEPLTDVEPAQIKALAYSHFEGLIHADDAKRTGLAFWRFGPEIEADEINNLWAQLPADTRIPDHTIFDHLDLTTALAGCFVQDPENGPALLAVSLGPVQEFIAASRSTSDLWAGSHLLSRLAWEAMRVICDELGPESILFPRLRGVPQVDLWLQQDCGLESTHFESCDWTRRTSDGNPLFAATLPNRFTALVPANMASFLAEKIANRVREWILEKGQLAFKLLLEKAGIADNPELPGYAQLREQLSGFPEVHWVSVPWSLVETKDNSQVDVDSRKLSEAMQPFFTSEPPGFLGSESWGLLSKTIQLEEGWFWKPNPGALYPALHELLERALAATKSVRPFEQTKQMYWRDSLSGEAEWLTTDRKQLESPPGKRKDTLWIKVAEQQPSWVKKGEHLSALNSLKRLWPNLFVQELKQAMDIDINRFVVSTHTMALASSLSRVIKEKRMLPGKLAEKVLGRVSGNVALPQKLASDLRNHPDGKTIAAIPGWLESVRDLDSESDNNEADKLLKEYLGVKPETYFGLVLMDGDRMGAWVSADPEVSLPYECSFHPQIRAGLQSFRGDPNFKRYAESLRKSSPSRHMAISEALNNFALTLAPEVVERQYCGRILYAGGDDLMAMLPTADLLPAMAMLRAAYSGVNPKTIGLCNRKAPFSSQGNGYILHRDHLLRMMGNKATASSGAVIAHHQAPLGAVLRELRAAEQRAKQAGGRDAFSISIIKRSGGALSLTAKWGDSIHLLIVLSNFLGEPDVSRRAVYNSALWLKDLPEPQDDGTMISQMLADQLQPQNGKKSTKEYYDLRQLATGLVKQSIVHAKPGNRLTWLTNFLSTAEFLARETRGSSTRTDMEFQEVTA